MPDCARLTSSSLGESEGGRKILPPQHLPPDAFSREQPSAPSGARTEPVGHTSPGDDVGAARAPVKEGENVAAFAPLSFASLFFSSFSTTTPVHAPFFCFLSISLSFSDSPIAGRNDNKFVCDCVISLAFPTNFIKKKKKVHRQIRITISEYRVK